MKYEELANWRHYLSKDYLNSHKGAVTLAILFAALQVAGAIGGAYVTYSVIDLQNRVSRIEQNPCPVTLPDNR